MAARKATGADGCECMSRIDGALREHNTKLAVTFCLSADLGAPDVLPIVATEKIDRTLRGKTRTVLPTFCPFCGMRYRRADKMLSKEARA
jgi:hypothetical protein